MGGLGKSVVVKGHCHAIWQLFKKLEGLHQLNFKTNDVVLLFKTI